MKIIGLTGLVASGKNLVAEQFKKLGVAVFDADLVVHQAFEKNLKILEKIKNNFPKTIIDGKINRHELGKEVLDDKNKLNILEKIIHPEVRKSERDFIKDHRRKGAKLVVLNIPLLFEKGGYKRCDKNILVVVSKLIQKERFLKRALQKQNLSSDLVEKKLQNIISNQISNHYKKKLADFIIYNGLDKASTLKQTKKIFNILNNHD